MEVGRRSATHRVAFLVHRKRKIVHWIRVAIETYREYLKDHVCLDAGRIVAAEVASSERRASGGDAEQSANPFRARRVEEDVARDHQRCED